MQIFICESFILPITILYYLVSYIKIKYNKVWGSQAKNNYFKSRFVCTFTIYDSLEGEIKELKVIREKV